MPLGVGLRPAGSLQLSDLFVGMLGERFVPSSRVSASSPISTLLEIYTADPAEFAQMTVTLELRRSGQEAIVASADAKVATTELDRRRVADGQILVPDLAPGAYSVSALVRKGPVAVAKVSRTVVVTAP